MTLDAVVARMRSIRDGFEALAADPDRELSDEEQRTADWLAAEFEYLRGEKEALEERATKIEAIRQVALDPRNVSRGTSQKGSTHPFGGDPDDDQLESGARSGRISNPWDYAAIRRASMDQPSKAVAELRSRAVEAVERTKGLSDASRNKVLALLDSIDEDEGSVAGAKIARHVLATSDPEYRRAFSRALRSFAATGLPDPESVSVLQRAMSLTDNAGGFAVPLPIDPTLILNDNGSVNPFRRISTVKQITSDVLRTVNSTAVSASWDAEATEVSDDATTFANIDITPAKAQAFVPFSIEISQDYPGFSQDIAMLLADARDNLEASGFATGSGSNQPVGIVTALQGGTFEIASNTTDVFALGDVYDLEEELVARYRDRACWVANKRIYQAIREAGGANLDDFWANLGPSQPSQLLGYPTYESSAMDGVIDAAADNRVLILGDFSDYWIVDRVGLSVELIPNLVSTNHRPSGQRGFYAYWRVGADSVNDRAFRLLNVT